MKNKKLKYFLLKICQNLSKKGIANSGEYDRVLFFISTNNAMMKSEDLDESFEQNKAINDEKKMQS